MRSELPVLLALLAVTLTVAATDDPWLGKPRSEIVGLLGEPDKARRAASGETLTYRFFRVDDDAAPGPDIEMLDVPGVGVVGRIVRHDPLATDEVAIEPSGVDDRGRPTGNTMPSSPAGGEASWNPGSGLERSWQETGRPTRKHGKVTVKFRLDGDGRVAEWSTSPKKKPR